MKRSRQQALLELVTHQALGSQEEIRVRLAAMGHVATQSTISRDIDELGLVRIRGGDGRPRYAVPLNGGEVPTPPLESLLREFVVAVERSGNIVLLKTPRGAAGAVAEGIDRAELPEVLGTIAGDDTILAVITEDASPTKVAEGLRHLAGLP